MNYDYIVVGSGPSGIFFAYEMLQLNQNKKILLIEQGKEVEKRHCPINEVNVSNVLNVTLPVVFPVLVLFLMVNSHYMIKKMMIFMLVGIFINI